MSWRATLAAMPRLAPSLTSLLPPHLHDLRVVEVLPLHDIEADPDVLCADAAGDLWSVRRGGLIEGATDADDEVEINVERCATDGSAIIGGDRHTVRWPAWL